jgi:hypothetical protein
LLDRFELRLCQGEDGVSPIEAATASASFSSALRTLDLRAAGFKSD